MNPASNGPLGAPGFGEGERVTNPNELRRQVEALEECVAKLSVADTVLQEVVDSARALTGARYGVIVTVDPNGAD